MLVKLNDKFTNKKYDKMTQLKSKQSEINKNEVITITTEHPYSEDNFKSNFQAKLSHSNKSSEQPAEKLIEFKGEQQMEANKF